MEIEIQKQSVSCFCSAGQNSCKTAKIIFETALSLFKQYYGTYNVTVLLLIQLLQD